MNKLLLELRPSTYALIGVTFLVLSAVSFYANQPIDWLWNILQVLLAGVVAYAFHWASNREEFHSTEQGFTWWLSLVGFIFFAPDAGAWRFLCAALFFAFAMRQTGMAFRQQDAKNVYFNAGFLFGLGAILEPSMICVVPAFLICIAYTRSGVWREWILGLLGWFLPALMAITLCWYLDRTDLMQLQLGRLSWESKTWSFHWSQILLGILIVWSVIGLFGTFASASNKARNTKTVYLLLSFSFAFAMLASSHGSFLDLSGRWTPFWSLILPFCMVDQKQKWWWKVLFWLILLSFSLSTISFSFNTL